MAIPIGDVVGQRYRVDSEIGRGGFATVYMATDRQTGRQVALKVLDRSDDGYARDVRLRFDREATILSGLPHPNIVELLDYGSDDVLFLAFELVGGEDLSVVLADGSLSLQKTTEILRQLLAGLIAAHDAGVLHRDIKPENIRVMDDGRQLQVKLLDFGIARPTDHGSPSVTRTGEMVGTPRYMSPEQLRSEPLGPASDVYSAGIVAFEMLLGRDALHGNRWIDQLDRLRTGHLFALPELGDDADEFLDVIDKMTAVDPHDRFPSARAALRALDETNATAPRRRPDRDTAPTTSRSTWAVPFGLLLAGGIAVAIAFMAPSQEADSPPPPAPADTTRSLGALVKRQADANAHEPPPIEVVDLGTLSTAARSSSGCGVERFPDGQTPTHLPRDYDPTRAYPVVVLLRDRHMLSDRWLKGGGFAELADERGFIVIAPRPPDTRNPWRTSEKESVVHVSNTVATAALDFCVDESRIFVVGHGHGAAIADHLRCKDWVAATSTYHHHTGYDRCDVAKPHLLLFPNQSDNLRIDDGEELKPNCESRDTRTYVTLEDQFRRRNRCAPEPLRSWTVAGAACKSFDCETMFTACIYDGGRSWPGAEREPFLGSRLRKLVGHESLACDGPTPEKFRPADLVWEFFADVEPVSRDASDTQVW